MTVVDGIPPASSNLVVTAGVELDGGGREFWLVTGMEYDS